MTTATNSSVDQVFDVLAVLSNTTESIGVSQLARMLEVPTSTAHRVLATLQEAGYVTRDTSGTEYQLGLGAQELTHALLRRFPVQTVIQPYLRRLAAATGDTVVLTCRVGWYAVRMAGTEGWREIHAAPRLGQTTLLEDSPGGRALLAFADDVTREGYFRHRAAGRRPSGSLRATQQEIEDIRGEGFVLNRHADGRGELAVPIRDAEGRAVAAITVEAAEPDGGARVERTRLSRTRAIAAEFEVLLRERPELGRDPFGHLEPEELDPGFEVSPLG